METGSIKTGALIIQKSSNGTDWVQVDLDDYSNGLYVTDFYNRYGNQGDILIYSPSGEEYLNGLYIKVLYAYEVYQKATKTQKYYLEEYQMYVCSDDLGAVTFHNLSARKKLTEQWKKVEEAEAKLQMQTETLLSGSGTATGFTIDVSKNPTVTYKVRKNGMQFMSVTSNKEFTESGRYDIYLTSALGTTKTVTLYVDDNSSEEALRHYFSAGFLTDKRIYDEDSEYPVYEGGKTVYHVEAVSDSYLPISGTITNTSTGKIIEISRTKEEKKGTLTEPGDYVAVFTTKSKENPLSGDYRIFTFRFKIIKEGSAPGPMVNRRTLKEYNQKNISDSYPMYYGLTYQSAGKGNITLAFATKEAALAYAYEYEKGLVEKQSDGTYRYSGNLSVKEKEAFDSNWDLTEAVNYFAEQAVQKLYFDMTESFNYVTLEDSVIKRHNNLRQLELNSSVKIFAEEQKELLCSKNILPSISDKPYIFLQPVLDGKQDSGYAEFKFIKDERGIDSASVVITDVAGKQYTIEYDRSVAAQLSEQGCSSGIVTVTESTVYGDSTSYQAVYIAKEDNTAEVTLSYYSNGEEHKITINKADAGKMIEVDAFSIEKVVDELDPYNLISISNGKKKEYYVADQQVMGAWAEQGTYTIQIANRLGYSYSFTVIIRESKYAFISFTGIGMEDAQSIISEYGQKDVKLPKPEQYGYELIGYKDITGKEYGMEIATVLFKGDLVLEPVWEAKLCTVRFLDEKGNSLIADVQVPFGSKITTEVPVLSSNEEFLGWMLHGKLLPERTVVVESEDGITLVASIKEAKKFPIGLVVAIILAILVVVVVIKNRWKIKLIDKCY